MPLTSMRCSVFVALMATCLGVASAQQPLTNDSIVQMVKAGLGETVVVDAIHTQPHQFSLSANDLIALKQAGVSNAILAAMLTAEKPASEPSVSPAPAINSIANVRTIFIDGNNEAASNARNDMLKIASKHPNRACFRPVGIRKAADAILEIAESDTAGGSGGILGGTSLETTVASGTLTNAEGDLLWSNSKQGMQGVFHTGAGDAAQMLLLPLYIAAGCDRSGLRQGSVPQTTSTYTAKQALITNSEEALSSPGASTLTPQEVQEKVQNGKGSICSVFTVPPGAEIDIDNNRIGISPIVFMLLRKGARARVITIKLNGYKTEVKTVVPDGKSIPIGLALQKVSK